MERHLRRFATRKFLTGRHKCSRISSSKARSKLAAGLNRKNLDAGHGETAKPWHGGVSKGRRCSKHMANVSKDK
eukprot:1891403-Pleurochrysis_carterae.AAC.1